MALTMLMIGWDQFHDDISFVYSLHFTSRHFTYLRNEQRENTESAYTCLFLHFIGYICFLRPAVMQLVDRAHQFHY